MDSMTYWRERESNALKAYESEERNYRREMNDIFLEMLDEISKEISHFYQRYADENGLTLAQAKKRCSKLDMEEYERLAAKYVKDKDMSDLANEQMAIYNLTMKVNRLKLLMAKISIYLANGYFKVETLLNEKMTDRAIDEMKRQAGIFNMAVLPESNYYKFAQTLVKASFHSATWSQRLWKDQAKLKESLSHILTSALIQGLNPRTIVPKLKRQFDTSSYVATRLMRTELARVQTGAQQKSFEDAGFDEYMFITQHGEGPKGAPCPLCLPLDGKVFKVKDMMPGTNSAPMHPNCRCSVAAAYGSREDFDKFLDTYDQHGIDDFNEWKKAGKPVGKAKEKIKPVTEQFKVDDLHPAELAGVKLGKAMTFDEADTRRTNPNYGKRGYAVNCQTCVVANEARRRGYDVIAKANYNNSYTNALSYDSSLAWLDPLTNEHPKLVFPEGYEKKTVLESRFTGVKMTPLRYLKFLKSAVEEKARYTFEFVWKSGRSGHIINLDRNENGELRLHDNQRGQGEKNEWVGDNEILEYLKRISFSSRINKRKVLRVPAILRIDNLKFDVPFVNNIFDPAQNANVCQ